MDRLGPLNAFVQAAETRSFTAAGRMLGISASAVGKAIARLEERLGAPLFHRSTRTMTLTPEGARFLKRCQTIFAEIEAAELEIAESTAPQGMLRVSLPLIGMLMTPALAAFAEAYPEIQLELDFTDRLVDVIEEGFDVVMRTGKVSDSNLKTRVLGNYGYVIVGSPAYLSRCGVPRGPEDLAGHACLFHRWTATGKLERWVLSRDGADLDFRPPASAVANTMEPLIGLAERGLGLVYTPTFTVRRQLADGTLRSVLDGFLRQSGTLQVLWPPSRHGSPKIKAFIDVMARTMLAEQA
ncbi:LysR family transcriptional regulator [Lichenihabitans sp. PAMC28606]|uniref:LysR family transcriptional regulator n=1 Tax=Lichenihabitans sp. PAMC28606 TaxID=2880932 RepID=UPI001D0A23B8|nr:LysR family transcriptional regulator [Lichenihabitans sp. PAMC28606]UDL94415.1 LysR family transcriptional regulator [Lichenihabitans sp. PAMC28606]